MARRKARQRRRARRPRYGLWLFWLILFGGIGFVLVQPEAQPARDWAREKIESFRQARASEKPLSPPDSTQPSLPGETWSPGLYSGQISYAGLPLASGYPHRLTILENIAYVVGYCEDRRNPAWSAYRIPGERRFGTLPRPSRFSVDVRTIARVRHEDYTRSGFDRGHMTPNFAIASRFGERAQNETFLMTNVVPQRPALNQGPWRLLEEVLAETVAPAVGEVWVVVGPVYGVQPSRLPGGPAVPEATFMAIVAERDDRPIMQAFIIGQDVERRADFRGFQTSVRAIEEATGLDFFHLLPDWLEEQVETAVAPYWLAGPN